jgi:hypothetical protein
MATTNIISFLIIGLLFVIPFWVMCGKVGIAPMLSLLAFIPVVGILLVMAILAFAPWPNAAIRKG